MLTGNQILRRLKTVQLSFTDIARLLSVTPQHVHHVAHRKACSSRTAKALSVAIGLPFEEVFEDQPQYHRQIDPQARVKRIQATHEALLEAGYDLKPLSATR
ncbi:hypothetical protein FHP88_15605 [Sedimenticola selenatireducens]|uniref:Uncharacterized protein n=1 Tax=Sedimenticola selenatireducens TaxID=191960 RepID=A0A557S0K3_9GAMM|nr:hypothetical protein [Sedimenticola selenatireducens]TVO70878.1 hypothetical protein FHP88_15605 [Sedimenticola selenatireducens]